MTAIPLVPTDDGAAARAKINALIDSLDQIRDALATKANSGEVAVINAQLALKTSTFDLAGTRASLEALVAATRAGLSADVALKADAATATTIEETVAAPTRPGEARRLWTTQVEGTGGASIPSGWAVTDTDGAVARLPAGTQLAPKAALRVEAGRLYQVRFAVRRRTDPVDPASDTVRLALRLLGPGKGALGNPQRVVEDMTSLTVASGRQQRVVYVTVGNTGSNWTATPPSGAPPAGKVWLMNEGKYLVDNSGTYVFGPSGSVLVALPVGVTYLRPFVQTFGTTGVDVELVERLDVTAAAFASGADLAIFGSRLSALEGFDAGSRLTVLEQLLAGPQLGSFVTRTAVETATIPSTVSAIRTLRADVGRPLCPAEWARADVEPGHPGKVQSADGAWWELKAPRISLYMLGAVPNDPAYAAQNRAALAAAGGVLAYGGVLDIPNATFFVAGAPVVFPDGVSISGQDPYASALVTTQATGILLDLGHASYVEHIKGASTVDRTADAFIRTRRNGTEIRDCEFAHYFVAVEIGDGTTMAIRPTVRNCAFYDPCTGAGSGAILARNFSNLIVSENVVAGSVRGALQPDWGIRLLSGDTAFLTSNNVTLHGTALLLDPDGNQNLYAVKSVGNFWDSPGTIASNNLPANAAQIAPRGGGIFNTKMTGDWFGLSAAADGLLVTTFGGTVNGLQLTGCEWMGNAQIGCHIAGPNVLNFRITGGQSAGNGSHGVSVAGCILWGIVGLGTGEASARGKNGGYGIFLSGANDNYQIVANDLLNNTTGPCNDPTNSPTKLVRNNLGLLDASRGSAQVTFDSNGYAAIAHGLIGIPLWADVKVLFATGGERAILHQVNSTQLILRLAITNDNSKVTGGPWTVMWGASL